MKIQHHMPRKACISFLRWFTIGSSFIALVFFGMIVVFVTLMPNDRHGWLGIRYGIWSFLPGVLIFGYGAFSAARELRTIRKLPATAFKIPDSL